MLGVGLGLTSQRRRAALPPETSTTFNWDAAGITYGGTFLNSSPDRFTWGLGNANSGIDFDATGTTLELSLRGSTTTTWYVTVDGVTTQPTVSTTGYSTVTVFDGPHARRNVKLRNVASQNGRVPLDATFGTLYGQPPSIAYAPGLGVAYPVKDTTNSGNNRAFLKDDGSLLLGTVGGGYGVFPLLDAESSGYLRFKATASAVSLWLNRGNGGFNPYVRLVIDDVPQSAPIQPTFDNNTWGWLTWAGLDGGAEHEYRMVLDSQARRTFWPWAVSVVGTLNTGTLANKAKKVLFYGDSITDANGVSYLTDGFAYLTMFAESYGGRVAGLEGRTVRNYGAGGSSPGGGWSGESDVVRSISNYATDWDEIVILLGANDAGAVYAAFNQANVQTSYSAMLTAIRTACATSKIRCLGVLNASVGGYGTNRTACNTAISDAVTAAADANITYHSTDGWIDPATDTADGLHPNTAGVAKIVTQLRAII